MDFTFIPYSQSQIKEYINSTNLYTQYLAELEKYNKHYCYYMGIQNIDNQKYLYKQHKVTGKRTYINNKKVSFDEALAIKEKYSVEKKALKKKIKQTKELLSIREKYNKFEKINRVPNELVAIFSRINELGLDKKIILIGTNSLYLYEAKCGVFLEQTILSTTDIDLFNKRNTTLSLAVLESSKSIKDVLKSIDKSFEQNPKVPYAFINKNKIEVELINPLTKHMKINEYKQDPLFDKIIKLEMNKIEWLENSRLFESIIIAENGKMAKVHAIHPLDYAVYKVWLSKQKDRNILKSTRDKKQAKVVTLLIQNYMPMININHELSRMLHINKNAIDLYKKEIL